MNTSSFRKLFIGGFNYNFRHENHISNLLVLSFLRFILFGSVLDGVLGCSASRGMRQTFSCLSKLEGTTNLIRLLFGHVK